MREFDYSLDYDSLDLREHPELYSVGRGEQGVLRVQPYKSELLPLWRFATADAARESSEAITERFHAYLADDDFVGADMARKFLQMGYTRSRRYANHRGGKKYDGPVPDDKKGVSGAHGRSAKPRLDAEEQDPEKVAAARIFKAAWRAAADDPTYQRMKKRHRDTHENV
ncbi:DUF4385 domain-containing protein [Nocardioides sp. CFH 31398]|uniref:DUF4385 domain-containing protein n=1 Tax=Nocardioides sp. CFH 31398 TaxID=2919579 RepID=UPI001F052974|nr:DUF4385 domain-containing protein [Nocardioides sp. CFH 31398]MCH1865595.1 DUF4385 domain-containing protein [Nocardioides sp. CFH 31398]